MHCGFLGDILVLKTEIPLFVGVATILTLTALPSALAQSAIEHHVWQDARTFKPFSRTAIAITGPITLSGNQSFARVGSSLQISFDGGSPVELVSEGASWREWQLVEGKQTAEIFQVTTDPGPLLNGNTVCGDDLSYLVFSEGNPLGSGLTLEVAAFSGDKPPFDIHSSGLCGTFSFSIE